MISSHGNSARSLKPTFDWFWRNIASEWREYANIADIGPVEDDEKAKILPLDAFQGLLRDVSPVVPQTDLDGDEIPF